MDSRRVQRAARHGAALAVVFIAAYCTLFAQSAYAASSCLVEERVLRDGIVTLPLAPGSPGSSPVLSSLGKVQDEEDEDRYSIWRIENAGTTDVRVVLEAVGDPYQIPVLARAGTATLVRSDRAAGSASHRLVIGGVAGTSVASGSSQYSDQTELTDSDCQFEGRQLYVAEQSGTLKVSTIHGAAVAEIPSSSAIEMLTTQQDNGDVWTLSDGTLRQYTQFGEPVRSVTAPGSASLPSNLQHLAVSGEDIWLARGNTLYLLNVYTGDLIGSVTYGETIRELGLDTRRGKLWVLLASSARFVRSRINQQDPILELFSITLTSPGKVLAYDPFWSETWIGTTTSLTRYDAEGTPTVTADNLPIYATDHLVADGVGGLWGANGGTVFHLNESYVVDAQLQPFSGLSLDVVDIAANPVDASVWVAAETRLRNYSRTPTLLQDVIPHLADGVIRELSALELYADRTPPYIRVNSPAYEAVVTSTRPVLEMAYDDPHGIGVDPGTIEFTIDGVALPATCVVTIEGSSCTPDVDLPQGEVTIEPWITDLAGNVSDPAPHTFTVDSDAPPVITIQSPPDQHVTNTVTLDLVGMLDRSAVLTINGQAVTLNSEFEFGHEVTLQEGLNTFLFVAVDAEDRESERTWRITLDTVAPGIPNVASITLSGAGTGVVTVEGAAGAVEANATVVVTNLRTGVSTTVVAAADGSFEAEIAAESGDELRVEARDAAGNAANATVTVDGDTQPPALPQINLITVQTDSQLVASVQGAAGAVEANVRVEISSFNTNGRVTVQATSSGSFTATIQVAGFDAVLIRALDDADNASDSISISAGQQPTLVIDGPSPGSVPSGSARVWGHIVAPPSSGVSVNDERAIVTETAGVYTFEGRAEIVPGSNTVTVALHLPDGRILAQALQLTGTTTWTPYLKADRTSGNAFMINHFTIEGVPGLQFSAVEYDFESDGTVDLFETGTTMAEWEFPTPGTYTVTARLLEGVQVVGTATTTIVVRTPEETQAAAMEAWNGFLTALSAANAQTAATRMTFSGGRKYAPVFTALAANLGSIAAQFSTPVVTEIGHDYVEFVVVREIQGVQRAFFGYALLCADGIWRIQSI